MGHPPFSLGGRSLKPGRGRIGIGIPYTGPLLIDEPERLFWTAAPYGDLHAKWPVCPLAVKDRKVRVSGVAGNGSVVIHPAAGVHREFTIDVDGLEDFIHGLTGRNTPFGGYAPNNTLDELAYSVEIVLRVRVFLLVCQRGHPLTDGFDRSQLIGVESSACVARNGVRIVAIMPSIQAIHASRQAASTADDKGRITPSSVIARDYDVVHRRPQVPQGHGP